MFFLFFLARAILIFLNSSSCNSIMAYSVSFPNLSVSGKGIRNNLFAYVLVVCSVVAIASE